MSNRRRKKIAKKAVDHIKDIALAAAKLVSANFPRVVFLAAKLVSANFPRVVFL